MRPEHIGPGAKMHVLSERLQEDPLATGSSMLTPERLQPVSLQGDAAEASADSCKMHWCDAKGCLLGNGTKAVMQSERWSGSLAEETHPMNPDQNSSCHRQD